MTAAAEPQSPSASTLHAALLDYFSAPGKYQLSLRQPATLFASIREILQVAAGRGASGELPPGQTEKLREAAAFFIRAALLYPGADHYAVLGLPARVEPFELKERYRLLMRLIHPDFMPAGSASWPADAAVRVNRANEVLSSPTLRKEYDEQLASLHSHRAAEAAILNAHRSAARTRKEERTWHVNTRAVWALVGAAGIAGVFMLMPSPESTDLVQKLPVPLPAPQRLADTEIRKPVEVATAPPAVLTPSQSVAPSPVPAPSPAPAAIVAVAPPAPAAPPVAPARPVAAPVQVAPAAPPAPYRNEPRPQPQPAVRTAAPAPALPLRREPPALVAAAPTPVTPARSLAALLPPSRPIEEAPPVAPPPPPAPAPTPVVAVTAPPLPGPPPVAVARPAVPIPAAAAIASPTLADVQPLLSQLLQMLESGRGEQLLRLLEADARRNPSAQALSNQYDQLVHGGRPVRLTQVDFRSEAREGVLQVTGRIRLHAGEPTIGSHGERFLFRAEFMSRNGRVQLTGLSGASD